MDKLLYRMGQLAAVQRITTTWERISRHPISEEDQKATAENLSDAIRLIDPKRCRALVILALQDPDPAKLKEGLDPTDCISHTTIGNGYITLMKGLCAERLASFELMSEADPSGSDVLAETLRQSGIDPAEHIEKNDVSSMKLASN